MSQLSSSSNTINKLGTTGLGAQDSIGHKLYFFQQLNAKIIGYVAAYSTYGGIYYVEGDITDFLDSYSYFWINTREMGDKNVFSLDALGYSYIEDRMCTEIYINATALDASNYTADKSDLFANICGRYDATDLIKEIGNFNQQLVEEGSIGNSSASTIDITINDEERLFYDKVNRIGYFYPKKVLTEIFSVADRSEYASATKLYSTFLKVKDLTKYYSGSDFENGWLEFITGEAAGSKALIIDSNGYNINVRGQFAHCYSTSESYPIEVTKGDRIRLIKQDVYWFRLDLWHRAYIDEKVSFSGKIDLSSVRVQDQERSLTFKGYNTLKDLMAKDLSHLSFDTGLNLPRLKEVKTIFLSKCVNKGMKLIQKSEVTENPLASIKITEVAFDVSEGWHIFDYHPQGNLFRFDLGFWYQAVDEGSFENSTNSIFIAGHSISTLYNNEAEIPDHTLASNTDEENVKIERKWHGEWCKFTVDTKEDFFVGSVNNQKLKDGTFKPKKFSGLPSEPFRLLFYVNADRSIGQQTIFNYSFDNGAVTIPNILFDYAEEVTYQSGVIVSAANETYAVGMGAVSYRKAAATYPWNDLSRRFRLGCFKKFNGMYIKFRNEDSSYTNQLSRMLQRLQIRFSDGNDDYGSNFISNINSRYLGGYCLNDPVANNNLRLEIYDPIAVSGSSVTSFDSHYTDIAKMHLLCTSGNNAFQSRKIDTASEVVGDFSQIDVVLKSGYDHNIDQNDKFTIINKDDDVRFIDVSDTFKDGKNPDVLARESDDLTAGTFYDIIANHHTEVVYSDLILKPGDKVYVGHRDKFNSFALGVDIDTTGGNDYSDIAWFLRRDFFNIEYWNGNAWKKANNVSIVPSSVTNLKDSSTTIYSDDDIIKYKVFFEADDWNVGSYNHNSYSASGAPSNIDEDKIYSIRVTISSSMPVYLKYVSLCKSNDLNLAVIWNDIKSWSMNSSYIYSGKMIVDTLTNANLNLNLYSIELCAPGNSKIAVIEARPIEKFVGYNGSELYAMIDYNNIDPKVSEDVILYDNTKSNNISHLPVNINYQYLIQKILDDNGFKYNKDINNSLDHFNSANKNVINLIGSGYDGSYPIDVGWDSAFVTEDLANYDFSGSYRHISIIRSDGEYKAYAVHSDLGGVDLWTSDDMKTWANQGAVIGNIGSYEILAIDVVKNRDDEDYAFYITARTTDRYKLFIVVTAVHTTVDMNNAKEIVELLNRNIGSVSVLHIKGVSDDTSD